MSKALLIVDVQNDFVEGGALGVTGGLDLASRLEDFLELTDHDMILASRDAHNPDSDNGGHFSDNPDFKETWPVHCVWGTTGYDYAFTAPKGVHLIDIFKGQDSPSYSAFEGVDVYSTKLHELLQDFGIDELDVMGIATDYCVKASVLDALSLGYKVTVLTDLVAGVDPVGSEESLAQMKAAGAVLSTSLLVH